MEDDIDTLITGARYGDLEDVCSALRTNVDVNCKDDLGRTGLHMASANGHLEIVRFLIEAGADIDVTNCQGNTPLHWACLNGHVEVVKALMMHGAAASALNAHQRTPVDEGMGQPFQEELLAAVNSFFKTPLVEGRGAASEMFRPCDDEMEEEEGAKQAPDLPATAQHDGGSKTVPRHQECLEADKG